MGRGTHVDPEASARVEIATVSPNGRVMVPEVIRECVPWLNSGKPPILCIAWISPAGGVRLTLPDHQDATARAHFFEELRADSGASVASAEIEDAARFVASTWLIRIQANYQVTPPEPIKKLGLIPGPGKPVAIYGAGDMLEIASRDAWLSWARDASVRRRDLLGLLGPDQ